MIGGVFPMCKMSIYPERLRIEDVITSAAMRNCRTAEKNGISWTGMADELLSSGVYAEKELLEDKSLVYPDCKHILRRIILHVESRILCANCNSPRIQCSSCGDLHCNKNKESRLLTPCFSLL